ncbi:hypothetical protein B0I37DRAFT_422169 [Chaetomium sp. MPI-CAGE-AT-0009]|nr:hypothetical protein B0I37DRAFT_422169 [Chaetomium sp. MPI-CAGE-AT-0009]
MPSTKQWDSLPREIRLLILEALMQDGCKLGRLATVSREWQAVLERYNFGTIKLTPSRLADFASMVHRNRALVRYIWLCLELNEYGCTTCADPSYPEGDPEKFPITTSFQSLFSTLSTWEPRGDLVLDISIYSPSDSEHWFKYLTFLPDTPSAEMPVGGGTEQAISNKVHDDPRHGWNAGNFRRFAPPPAAILKVFQTIMWAGPFNGDLEAESQWWDQLPSVPVVTSLLLRQQNRRRWKPPSLTYMFARFPRLREVHYEPWREWSFKQASTDTDFGYFLESLRGPNNRIKRLTVFENFHPHRIAALASLKLEHLAASFIVDARYFFEIEPSWAWPNLTSLALTSTLLVPGEDSTEIEAVLRAAAAAAMKMPRLETMEIWNGRRGLAALFKYQALRDLRKAVITWRGTWELAIEPSTIRAWKAVMQQHGVPSRRYRGTVRRRFG